MIDAFVILIVALLRSVSGWLENSLEDGAISKFEWGLLGSTVLRVGGLALGLYFGLDMTALNSAGLSLAGDLALGKIKR